MDQSSVSGWPPGDQKSQENAAQQANNDGRPNVSGARDHQIGHHQQSDHEYDPHRDSAQGARLVGGGLEVG